MPFMKNVLCGKFLILCDEPCSAALKSGSSRVDPADFIGRYSFGNRDLSDGEKLLVPVLPEWYVIPEEVVDICSHATETTDTE